MLPGFASWVWRVLDKQLEQALYEDHRQERAAKHLCDLHSALGFTSVGHPSFQRDLQTHLGMRP